jgi:hypothetical protein
MNCYYCQRECKSPNSLRNHERLCKQNPNHQLAKTDAALKKAMERIECEFCNSSYTRANITRHSEACSENPKNQKECPVCLTKFSGSAQTCSYSCSNTFFRHGRRGGTQYRSDEEMMESGQYQKLCFRTHGKKCIVCGEEKIVAAHHINENHHDNRPENLVPLCPTHHQYMHSRYKDEIQPYIDEFLEKTVLI